MVAVVAAVVKMTLGRPVIPARVAVEAVVGSEAGCVAVLKAKGETFPGDEAAVMLPKMGLNMEDVEDVEAGSELTGMVAVVEVTAVQIAVFSLFSTAPKMGLKMGAVVDMAVGGMGTAVDAVGVAVAVVGTVAAAVTAGWLAGGVFSIPNRMLGFGKEGGLLGVWSSSVNTGGARLLGGCTTRAGGAVGEGVLNTGTGLASAEMAGRELDSNDTAGIGGCAADRGGWDAARVPVESGVVDTAWLLCIFFRLSRSEEPAGAGVVEAGIGPGEVTTNAGGLDTGIVSAVVQGTASALSSKTLLNHCSTAFFSASRSSEVTE